MATIEQNLQRLVNAKDAIASAIAAKGGTVAASDGFEEFATCIGTISGKSSKKDVNFYDYDGTIVNSYTAAEFANLTAMPNNPTHDGLTAQDWNWSLQNAKTHVASYGKLDIGQMYVTSDGKTRIYIELSEGRTSPILKLTLASGSKVDVDWGDGTAHKTLSGSGDMTTNRHEYASAGSYVISITVISGSITIPQYVLSNGNSSTGSPDKAYMNAIKKIEIGSSVTSIGSHAFDYCQSLSSITIPSSVTSIESQAFTSCSSLSSITIPSSVTSIGNFAFNSCSSLSSIAIPNNVTSIGENAFNSCSSLSSITIPSSVTSIGNLAFNSCYSLSSIAIPNNVTSIGENAFNSCSSLSSITIPSSVTSIGNLAFNSCSSLSSITIPSSVISIGSNAFATGSSLSSITIPSRVISIGSRAFYGCRYLEYCRFERTSPISISNSSTFGNWDPTLTKIFCPAEGLKAYKTATNYPDPSTFKYIGFATYEAGVQLPTTTQDQLYTYTWYATVEDWINNTNPITVGNGSEIYANITAV